MSVVLFINPTGDSTVEFSARLNCSSRTSIVGYSFELYKGNELLNAFRLSDSVTISGGDSYDTPWQSFTGLEASTTYTIFAYFFTSEDETESTVGSNYKNSDEFTTYSAGQTDFMTISIDDGYPTDTEAHFSIDFDESERYGYYNIFYYLYDSSNNLVNSIQQDRGSNYGWCYLDGLQPNTSYTLEVRIYCYANSSDTVSDASYSGKLPFSTKTFSSSTTTPPDLSDVYIYQVHSLTTQTQIGFRAAGFDTSYPDTLKLTFWIKQGSTTGTTLSEKPEIYIASGYSETSEVTVRGLTPGTKYYVAANVETASGYKNATAWYLCETLEANDTVYPDFDFTTIQCIPDYTSLSVNLNNLDVTGYEYGDFDIVWRLYNADDNPLTDSALSTKTDIAYFGDSKSQGVVFTGLSQNTEYYIEARIYFRYAGSNTYESKGAFFRTDADTSSAPDLSGISINIKTDECSEASLCFYVDGLDNTFSGTWKFYWEIKQAGSSTVLDTNEWTEKGGGNSSDTSLFNNLTAGTDYTVTVIVTYTTLSGKTGSRTISDTYTTDGGAVETPDEWTAYYGEQFSDLDSTVSVSYTLYSGEAIRLEFSCIRAGTITIYSEGSSDIIGYLCSQAGFNTSNGRPTSIITEDDDSGTGNNFLITYDIVAGQTYHLYFRCYSIDASGSVTVYLVPPQTAGRPALFEWENEKVAGEPFNITASEWCALLDNINEVRVYLGYSEFGSGSAVTQFTYPSKGDDFLALHFNQALMAIAGAYGDNSGYYSKYSVQKGDPVEASLLNTIVDLLNAL